MAPNRAPLKWASLRRYVAIGLGVLTLSACQSVREQYRLQTIHQQALLQHHYLSDWKQYGVSEYWAASLTGDCEDYALWMKDRVGGQLLYVRTPDGQLHVVLQVENWVIDSASAAVYPREAMRHKLIFVLTEAHVQSYLARASHHSAQQETRQIDAAPPPLRLP